MQKFLCAKINKIKSQEENCEKTVSFLMNKIVKKSEKFFL